MAKVLWTEPALDDLSHIVEYVARDSPVYAERLGTGLVEAPRRLEDFPLIGRMVPEFEEESIRELIYGSYRIIYLLRGEECYVTAVIHGSRDLLRHVVPGEWQVE